MAEISLYKKSNGAEWYLTYTTSTVSNGKTRVSWDLYKRGRTQSPTFLSTTIELYFTSDYTITAESNSILTWKPARFNTDPNSTGSNHPHRGYNPKHNSTPTKSGSFIITHNNDGAGNFKVQLKAAIETKDLSDGGVKTITLSTNYPYTACYWANNASVRIDKTIQKPGGSVTISWSGANSGTANPIDSFHIYYSIDNGKNWHWIGSADKTATSIDYNIPDYRGSTFVAKVYIINTQNNFTHPGKEGGSCKINRLPSAPTNLSPNQAVIPSTANSVSFSMNAGSDEDGQSSYTIKYATSEDDTKQDYTIGTNLSFETDEDELTYYFWTWDGLETSENNVSYTIIKNTKPTVSIDFEGPYVYEITATEVEGGQSNNSYSYGYTYGEDRLITTTTSTKCNVGDIRYHLSNQLNGLEQGKEYKFKYWVQRNDGVESSDRVYSDEISFTIPTLKLHTGGGPEGYFGTYIDIDRVDCYHPTGTVSIDNENKKATVSFDKIQRGEELGSIEFKNNENSTQSFNIKLASKLKRVRSFDFTNLQIPTIFEPYLKPILSISMAVRGNEYGFSEKSQPKLKINDQINGIAPLGKSSDNTWNFEFTPDHLWGEDGIISKIVSDGVTKETITLTIENGFGENFLKQVTLPLDFETTPNIDSFDTYANVQIEDVDTRVSLSAFDYVKEDIPVCLDGTIRYYNSNLSFKVVNEYTGEIIYQTQIESSANISPWEPNDQGGWESTPTEYDLTQYNSYKIPATNSDYTTKFIITATSTSKQDSAETSEIKIKRHTPSRIRFTSLNYSDGVLSGKFKIDDFGYDIGNTNGIVTKIELIPGNSIIFPKQPKPTNFIRQNDLDVEAINNFSEYEFSIEYSNFGESSFRSFAPACTTKLQAKYTTKEGTSYYFGEKIIPTDIYDYLIVYNILPTVAYRQNYLGINTKDPTNGGTLSKPVLTISSYNEANDDGHRYLYLVGANYQSSIDLTSGALSGFVVDCGSWDGTSGGIVPGSPNVPTGLARIAYTGDVVDLEQKTETTIVFSGGSAEEI